MPRDAKQMDAEYDRKREARSAQEKAENESKRIEKEKAKAEQVDEQAAPLGDKDDG